VGQRFFVLSDDEHSQDRTMTLGGRGAHQHVRL